MKKPTRLETAVELDASTLELGEEFQTSHCLLTSEVLILLQTHRHSKLQQNPNQSFSTLFQKALAHAFMFSRYKSKEVVEEIRRTLMDSGLAEFEMAQLANLCPESSEEAKSLVPSLKKITDDDLQSILDDLSSIRKFQS